jgi:hypothetical protein
MSEDSRTVFGLLELLSEFGGLQGIVVIVLEMIVSSFNDT